MEYYEAQKFIARLEASGGHYWEKYANKRVYFTPDTAFNLVGGGYSDRDGCGEGWLPGWGELTPFDADLLESVFFDLRDDTWKIKGSVDMSELIVALTSKFGVYPMVRDYDEDEYYEEPKKSVAPEPEEPTREYMSAYDTRYRIKDKLEGLFPGVRFKVTSRLSLGFEPDHGIITVKWSDGPSIDEVEVIVRPYIGTTRGGKLTQLRANERLGISKMELPFAMKDAPSYFHDVTEIHLCGRKVKISLDEALEALKAPVVPLPDAPRNPTSAAALRRAAADAKTKELQDALTLAASEEASQEEYAGLTDHKNSRVREALAKNPQVSADTLASIVRNSNHVRVALASNPNTPIEILRTLMTDGIPSIRIAVFHNPTITPDMLNAFGHDASPTIIIEMIASENVNPEHWAVWAKHRRVEVREFLAKSACTPLGILHWITLNENNTYINRSARATYTKRVALGESLPE